MQYNAMLGAASGRRPPKDKGVLRNPSCFTCTKMLVREGARVARCRYIGGAIPERTVWGVQQCAGFFPRTDEDFKLPGTTTTTQAGTTIADPREVQSAKKRIRTRQVTIIVPPSEVALIVPPDRTPQSREVRDGCSHHHSGSVRVGTDPIPDVAGQSTSEASGSVTDAEA